MQPGNFKLDQLTVLVVDDHAPIRKAMKRILAKMGVKKIVECSDGSDALKELSKTPVDLVLADIYMRKVSGFQILSHIRNLAVGSDTPFIVVTGEANKEDIVKASDLGADEYILKPFQAESLIAKVNQVLHNFYSPPPILKKLRQGDKLMHAKDYEGAKIIYTEALTIEPTSQRAQHSIAVALQYCGRHKEALEVLKKCIDSSPSYYKNYATAADIYLKENDIGRAIQFMLKELELNPKQLPRRVQIAKLLLKQGDALGASEHFRSALKEDSKSKIALLGAGQAFAKLEDIDKALYYFKRIRRYYPKESKALSAAVAVCQKVGQDRKAELMLRDEKQSNPERHDVYVHLAMLYLHQERMPEAIHALDELFMRDAENIEGLKLKASIDLKNKYMEGALDAYNKLVKKEPSIENYLMLADIMQKVNQVKESIIILHKVLFAKRDHPGVLRLLAQAFMQSKQYLKAFYLFQRVKTMGPLDEDTKAKLAVCFKEVSMRRRREPVEKAKIPAAS